MNTQLEYIRKKVFIDINFDNEETNYSKLTIPEKYKLISKIVNKNINKISKTLKITAIKFEKDTPFKDIIYFIIYTNPQVNHPIIGYIFKKNDTSKLTLIKPVGRKKHNVSFETLELLLLKNIISKKFELYALYLSIIESINKRKEEIITDKKFSLISCNNIKYCTKKSKIAIKNNSTKKSAALYQSLENLTDRQKDAITLINDFFFNLKKFNFKEAENILGTDDNKSRYNNLFKKNKKLKGHLIIFINLYNINKMIQQNYNKL